MMKKHLMKQFEYERWANTLLVASMESLTEVPEKITAIFSHLLAAQKVWLARLQDSVNQPQVWAELPRTTWQQHITENTQNLIAYLETLSEEALTDPIDYQNSKGETFSNTSEAILTHLLLHSAYHRGQVILLLKGLVEYLPATDYIFYLRSLQAPK